MHLKTEIYHWFSACRQTLANACNFMGAVIPGFPLLVIILMVAIITTGANQALLSRYVLAIDSSIDLIN